MASSTRLSPAQPLGAWDANDGSVDTKATGKAHFEVLDGLRGSAALLVVLFHIQGITVGWQGSRILLHHGPLAVDFFFALSGFVIGYAYDARWQRMSVRQFAGLRLIRLHPLVVLGVVLGFASYLLDPFAGHAQAAPPSAVIVALGMGLLLLPTWPLPNRFGDTHTLNGPCWSLFQEYLGNLAYALVLRRLPAWMLAGVAALSGLVLVACASALGSLDQGSDWHSVWMAPVRLCFPFVTGLWLYRVRNKWPRIQLGWFPLTGVMIAVMALPTWPVVNGIKLNGLYEAACVVLIFPAMVVLGAHSEAGRGMLGLCRASGRLSYPVYMIHFPFLYVWMNYVANEHASRLRLIAIGLALVPLVLLVAWAAHRFWDEPIRRRLRSLTATAGQPSRRKGASC
jgi:peptidoglycan/LPS O-acetylase OafA/YrhL